MFGLKKIKIDSNVTIWLKKLSLSDFLGCKYIPLISYGVNDNDNSSDEINDNEPIRILFDKAIHKIKGISKDDFIRLVLDNESLTSLIYNYIYFNTDKKKTFSLLTSTKI